MIGRARLLPSRVLSHNSAIGDPGSAGASPSPAAANRRPKPRLRLLSRRVDIARDLPHNGVIT